MGLGPVGSGVDGGAERDHGVVGLLLREVDLRLHEERTGVGGLVGQDLLGDAAALGDPVAGGVAEAELDQHLGLAQQ